MSGLILPGGQPPRGGLTLYVPRDYADEERVGKCYLCGTVFRDGEDSRAHFKRCAAENLDAIREARADRKKRLACFQEENWDPEFAAYMEKVGDRMRAEGRLALKPNERSYE